MHPPMARIALVVATVAVALGGLASPAVALGAAPHVDWSGRTLPQGVSRTGLVVDGLHTPLLQAGPRRAREAIVFVHGNPGSGADAVRMLADPGAVTCRGRRPGAGTAKGLPC